MKKVGQIGYKRQVQAFTESRPSISDNWFYAPWFITRTTQNLAFGVKIGRIQPHRSPYLNCWIDMCYPFCSHAGVAREFPSLSVKLRLALLSNYVMPPTRIIESCYHFLCYILYNIHHHQQLSKKREIISRQLVSSSLPLNDVRATISNTRRKGLFFINVSEVLWVVAVIQRHGPPGVKES